MWSQNWINLYERIKPFNASDIDITSSLQVTRSWIKIN